MEEEPDMCVDMNSASWLVDKVRNDRFYAQNLYAALCNMQWDKNQKIWSCSWRYAACVVVEMRGNTDIDEYNDFHCSGRVGDEDDELDEKYSPEGIVTNEVREDLARLGWTPVPYAD
jgi:hypothetical protein